MSQPPRYRVRVRLRQTESAVLTHAASTVTKCVNLPLSLLTSRLTQKGPSLPKFIETPLYIESIRSGTMQDHLMSKVRSLPDTLLQKSPYYILAVVYVLLKLAREPKFSSIDTDRLARRCTAMFLDLANLSAVTIALPTIQKDLNVKVAELQWTISAYSLTVSHRHISHTRPLSLAVWRLSPPWRTGGRHLGVGAQPM